MLRILVALASLAIVLSACETTSSFFGRGGSDPAVRNASPVDSSDLLESPDLLDMGLPLSPTPRFKDVPVPVDARQDMERTYVYETADLQIGRLVYTSKSKLSEIAQFYLEECPSFGWELQRVVQADGFHAFFNKTDKDLAISVSELGMGRGRRIILNLTPTKD